MIGVAPDGPLRLHLHDTNDPVSNHLMNGLLWHAPIVKFISRVMKPGWRFIDVGAHIGLLSVVAARAAEEPGAVISFEPDPDNRALLARNADENGVELDIRPKAIGDSVGRASLHKSSSNRAIHSLVPTERLDRSTEVEVSTLEAELPEIPGPSILKLDVQGGEPSILASTLDLWKRFDRAPFVIVEVNPAVWNAGDPGFKILNALRQRYRYDVHVFVANEGETVVPPVISWRTFMSMMRDGLNFWRRNEELDILLYPPAHT